MAKFSESKCNECNVSRCFDCADYYHYGRPCEEVMRSKVSWDNFLLQLAKTYPDIQMSAAVSAIEDNMRNADYFRQKISQVLLLSYSVVHFVYPVSRLGPAPKVSWLRQDYTKDCSVVQYSEMW